MAQQVIPRAAILHRQLEALPDNVRQDVENLAGLIGLSSGDIYLGHTFDKELSKLSFDVHKGHWIFTEALKINRSKARWEELPKWGIIGIAGGAALGAIQVYIRYKVSGKISLGDIQSKVKKGATAGAIVGGLWGAYQGMSSVHYRVEHVKKEIDSQHQRISEATQEILTTLFNERMGREVNLVCRLSGRLFHIPVMTHCHMQEPGSPPHIFEYDYLVSWIDRHSICPICTRDISIMDIRLATGIRRLVSEVARSTLSWLASQQSDEKVDILDKEKSFLENPQQIIQRIRASNLEGAELTFLSDLVREAVQDYNRRVLRLNASILKDISRNTERVGRRESFRLQTQLNEWTEAFEISLPEIEEPDPRENPGRVEV